MRRWEPTYEELKLSPGTRISLIAILLRAYLWGIETIVSGVSNVKSVPVLRAYLWGIETDYFNFLFENFSGLRAYLWGIETGSTYHITVDADGWEPTYEELKRTRRIPNTVSSLGWEPTYEELKLCWLGALQRRLELRAYLWGIETAHISTGSKNKALWLRAYLWGIETIQS